MSYIIFGTYLSKTAIVAAGIAFVVGYSEKWRKEM